MRKESAFTLIELMIVIAIIAIIAAIAIPSLLRSRIAANEQSASAGCTQLKSSQATWKQSEFDRNGVKDYWTRDVASLHFFTDAAGTKLELIDINFAYADLGASYVTNNTATATTFTARDKSGYNFQVMTTDQSAAAYQMDPDGDTNDYTNEYRYGICAMPSAYNTTGLRKFIMNEAGVVYSKDQGNSTLVATWPGQDPTLTASGAWAVEE